MATTKKAQGSAKDLSWVVKERRYVLLGNKSPITYLLRSSHHQNKPLQYFDGKNYRPLRYASNAMTPFMDEQDGYVIPEAIEFENGDLVVPANNTNLQKFLSIYHPDANKVYEEWDPHKDAQEELDAEEFTLDAQITAREMPIEELEAIARIVYRSDVSKMTSSEIKRDMIHYARANPKEFLDYANDPDIKLRNLAIRAVDHRVLLIKDDNRTVVWNDKSQQKVITVKFGDNPIAALSSYFKTDDGMDLMEAIVKKL